MAYWGDKIRRFSFGKDLRLDEGEVVEKMPKPRLKDIAEEGLETLLMLNFDQIFPGQGLRPARKTLNDWAGADIQATDPAQCQHVFEVKYGAPVNNVLDQALAYAIDVLRIDERTDYDGAITTRDELTLACRAAGFWQATRVDKEKRNDKLSPEAQLEDLLKRLCSRKPLSEADAPIYRDTARGFLERQGKGGWPGKPRAVHFHVVAPNPERIEQDQLKALERMVKRGVQATIWKAVVKLGSKPFDGQLFLQRLPVTRILTETQEESAEDPALPHLITSVLAAMAHQRPDLRLGQRQWIRGGAHYTAVRLPRFGFQMYLEGERLKVHVGTGASPYERAQGWDRRTDPYVRAVAEWVKAMLAPPAEVAQKLDQLASTKKEWRGECCGMKAKASHSGSGQTAWVSVDARCDLEPLAAFTAFALSEFDKVVPSGR